MYTLNDKALERFNIAKDNGLDIDYTPSELAQILVDQEVITFQNSKTSALFDIDDVVIID